MKKIKVLFLARRYAPHIGGVETHVAQVSAVLQIENCEVTVVTEQDDPHQLQLEKINEVTIWRIPLTHQQTNKFQIWIWIARHFSLFLGADVIHVHDVFFWILPIYVLLRLGGKKIFITFHGYEAPGPLTHSQILWHRLAAWLSDGNICVGGFHRKYYGVKPTITTYGGVSEHIVTQSLKKKGVAFVGRLAQDTGILAYLDAIRLLPQHLDVIGDGELREKCQNIVRKNNLDVSLHGFVANATDTFQVGQIVFSSQYLTILAALSKGCAVISYVDTSIKNDYLVMTPFKNWITIAHSSEEIAAAVLNPKVTSAAAIDWAQKQTWQKLAAEYTHLWKK